MKRHLFQRWLIWLLPLLLVRAFVPAGFMLSAQAGEISIVFCSSFVTAAQQGSDHAHQHHAGHSTDQISSSADSKNEGIAACPFAASGTAASIELPYFVGQPAPLEYELPTSTQLVASSGPPRSDRIRGPPV